MNGRVGEKRGNVRGEKGRSKRRRGSRTKSTENEKEPAGIKQAQNVGRIRGQGEPYKPPGAAYKRPRDRYKRPLEPYKSPQEAHKSPNEAYKTPGEA